MRDKVDVEFLARCCRFVGLSPDYVVLCLRNGCAL